MEFIQYSGKNLITDRRGRLGDEVIEAIEGMKSWRKAGLIPEETLAEVETMIEDLEQRSSMISQAKRDGLTVISGESDTGMQSDSAITEAGS